MSFKYLRRIDESDKHNRSPKVLSKFFARRIKAALAAEKAAAKRLAPVASAEQLAARDAQDKADAREERASGSLDRAVAAAAKELLSGKG